MTILQGPESKVWIAGISSTKKLLSLWITLNLDDNLSEQLESIMSNINFQQYMELNGQPVGVEEINSLRGFLASGKSVPYDKS